MEKVFGVLIISICVIVILFGLNRLWEMWAPCRWRN